MKANGKVDKSPSPAESATIYNPNRMESSYQFFKADVENGPFGGCTLHTVGEFSIRTLWFCQSA